MMQQAKYALLLGALGLGVTGCGNNGSPVVLTPQPPAQNVAYTQIERLSRPAIKEVFEPFQDHQISNTLEPYNDPTIKNDIIVTEDALRAPTATTDYGKALAGLLYPDEYTVDLSAGAPAGADKEYFLSNEVEKAFGGRAPNDDVIDLELSALFGNTLSAIGAIADDGEENTCLSAQNITAGEDPSKQSTNTFPYLPTPH